MGKFVTKRGNYGKCRTCQGILCTFKSRQRGICGICERELKEATPKEPKPIVPRSRWDPSKLETTIMIRGVLVHGKYLTARQLSDRLMKRYGTKADMNGSAVAWHIRKYMMHEVKVLRWSEGGYDRYAPNVLSDT